jgi:ribosomal-protein-alanine N-acetyltransferase
MAAIARHEVVVERMRSSDVDEILRIERACFSDPWNRQAFDEEAGRSGPMGFPLVARRLDAVVGYLVAWFVHDEIHLANIAVDPEEQRRGIGRLLLDRLLAEGAARRSAFVTLEVRWSNERAIRMYRESGFYEIAIRRGYYRDGEDALVMLRPIEAPAT